jgi:hypothetical protein
MHNVQKLCWHLSDTGLVISSKHMAHWSSSDTDASARERACMKERPQQAQGGRRSFVLGRDAMGRNAADTNHTVRT